LGREKTFRRVELDYRGVLRHTLVMASELLTPEQLHAHVQGLMSSQEPVPISGSGGETRPMSKILKNVSSPEMAADACLHVTSMVHKFMPKNSRMVRMTQEENLMGGHHYLHHVPTTEGPYVVDFTHRQFDESAPHPLVEPLNDFNQRKAAKQRAVTKTLSSRSTEAASSSSGNNRAQYALQMRWQKQADKARDRKNREAWGE
jgi:hypothetical protein